MQGYQCVGCSAPIGTGAQFLCLGNEGLLLLHVLCLAILDVLVELGLAGKELVAGLAEALEDGGVLLLGCKTNGAPLCLEFQNLLGEGIPFYLLAFGLGLLEHCLCLLAQGGLLCQILCLASLDALEVSLMALVYLC